MAVELIIRDGAEVRVETGVGRITEVKHQAGKRNAQVIIEAQGLREPVTGWADGTDSTLAETVKSYAASLQLVPYRIEVVRDAKAEKATPIADLPKRSKFRRLVALGDAADPWAGAAPVSSPSPAAAEPATGRSGPAPAVPEPTPEDRTAAREEALRVFAAEFVSHGADAARPARDMAVDLGASPEDLEASIETERNRRALLVAALKQLRDFAADRIDRESVVWLEQVKLCRELRATDDQMRWAQQLPPRDPAASDLGRQKLDAVRDPDRTGTRAGAPFDGSVPADQRPSVAAHSGLGHRAAPRGLADPAPFKRTYEDGPLAGQINPSSYEVGEAVGLVKLAQRLLIRRARALAGDEGTVVAPTVEQVHGLARALMLAADRVQIAVRGETSGVDRMSGLYRRATSAVWEAIDWYPYPGPDADAGAVAGWHAAVVEHATTTIRVAFALLGAPLPDPPPPAAAPPVAPEPQAPVAEPEPAGASA